MPFNRPTIKTLIERAESDIQSRLPATDPRLRRSMLNVVGRALAALTHGLYGYLDWLSKQIIPDTADAEILDRHAIWWNVARNAATPATGNVQVSGSNGITIPAGTKLGRSDGIEFTTDASASISAGVASIAVTATTSGQDTNTTANSSLSFVSPIGGVNSTATVDANGLSGGADTESDEALRKRLRERVQQTPQGGASVDYVQWAKSISGVTRVWVFPQWTGAGTIGVFFVRDDDSSLIPDAGEVTAVQNYIDAVKPVTANVTVLAPVEKQQAMTIKISPNDTTVQATIQQSLLDMFRREAQVEDGIGSGTVLISHIREAISIAVGEDNNAMVSPTADITLNKGELATLGIITWQSLP